MPSILLWAGVVILWVILFALKTSKALHLLYHYHLLPLNELMLYVYGIVKFFFIPVTLVGIHVLLAALVWRSKRKLVFYWLGLVINGLVFLAVFIQKQLESYYFDFFLEILLSSIVYIVVVSIFSSVAERFKKVE
ncbi:MAG TPA: hypothetical protein DCK87_05195 [Desulfotomaculum sp.]|nr:hypothetical protein [Desulfotomaculum sp.]